MTDHPITPPPELVEKWAIKSPIQHSDETWAYELFIAHQAARWGADQELEACCEWIGSEGLAGYTSRELRTARRPKPPSLKEQALKALDSAAYQPGSDFKQIDPTRSAILRRALEQLDD